MTTVLVSRPLDVTLIAAWRSCMNPAMRESTPRELVFRTVRFERTPSVPRNLWTLPWAETHYPVELETIRRDFPDDIVSPTVDFPRPDCMRGDPYTPGIFVDEWGCEFSNIQAGAIGEVKNPPVRSYASDLDKVRPPWTWVTIDLGPVAEQYARTNRFMLSPLCFRLFERMQFLRGTETLYIDLMEQPAGLIKMTRRIHEWNLAMIDAWAATDVDAILGMDDWGSQRSLLISPRLWRDFFKPYYRQYVERIHAAGKRCFFHSDGYIFDIYEDLIEIGVDAVNSQIFCMDIEEIGRRFKGRITFWGEVDRQHLLPYGSVEDVRRAVRRAAAALYGGQGGVIAQCEFGVGAKPENVRAFFEEWSRVSRKARESVGQ
ncbi:MAG: uroporphyrinogen decarboxylase family protein [Phycisphaerae bacterium]